MVDNRSAGYFGIGGAFNFKSGDISGTAARTQDDKMGQGGEYFAQQQQEEEEQQGHERYMDRSAVLRATLNSLAMMNVANVINAKKIEMEKNSQKRKNDIINKHGEADIEESVNILNQDDEPVDDIVD
ncbi:MAG: hypothetical protein KH301_08205 [Brachyspira sp.]|uniref:hypothetical protein n=1 Tax=Candidatus Scatousia sp. TaxID=3085663 RepID=UPI0040286AF9|nr:hypothetical protein [Brachyspira sp.]